MIDVPAALQPWAEELELLSGDAVAGLASWLAPLRALVGPMSRPLASSLGDPDGFAGLTRRGTYDHLLLSEWLLALELPEEFMRRAAMGEHVFTQPAFVTPHGASSCLLLLDCGPRQIGAPRLAQLVALLVMRARADASGAKFEFAILGDDEPPRSLHRQSLAWWSRASSWQDGQTALEAWAKPIEDGVWDEVWICGASSMAAAAAPLDVNVLTIEETREGARSSLHVVARARGQALRETTLSVPPTASAVRIMRSPLGSGRRFAPAVEVVSAASHMSICGRRLFMPDGARGFVGHHVPTSSRAGRGKAKVVPAHDYRRLVGVDVYARRFMALSINSHGELSIEGGGFGGVLSIGEPHPLSIEAPRSWRDDDGFFRLFVLTGEAPRFRAVVLDPQQQLWRIEVNADRSTIEVVDRSCHDLVRLGRSAVGWRSGSTGRLELYGASIDLDQADHSSAHFSVELTSIRWQDPQVRVGWVDSGRIFITGLDPATYQIEAPEAPLLGLDLSDQHNPRRPAVLFVKDGREVWRRRLHDANDVLLFRRSEPFAALRHEPSGDKIVWREPYGHLGVYCLRQDKEVLFLRAKEGDA